MTKKMLGKNGVWCLGKCRQCQNSQRGLEVAPSAAAALAILSSHNYTASVHFFFCSTNGDQQRNASVLALFFFSPCRKHPPSVVVPVRFAFATILWGGWIIFA
jgi:hypothetical protein